MTSITVAGTTIDGLDTIPGVIDAANKYSANPTPGNLTNYLVGPEQSCEACAVRL